MFVLSLSVLLSAASLVLASPLAVHDSRESAPKTFTLAGVAPNDKTLSFRVHLKIGDLEGLEKALDVASDPSSPTFREWLSKEDVESYARPSNETATVVHSWLASHGIAPQAMTTAGDWLGFDVPVSKANELLNTKYNTYTHEATGKKIIRTLEYSLPTDLHEHINAIHPTTSFNAPSRSLSQAVSKASTPTPNITDITPSVIQSLYSLPKTKACNKKNSVAVTGYINQYANKADLQKYLKKYRPDMNSNTSFTTISIDNGQNNQTKPGLEANLDMQAVVGLATGVPTYFITVGEDCNDGDEECYGDTFTALLKEKEPPLAISTSYGISTEYELSLSLSVSLCNTMMQLTARGVTITFATGDGGVASSPGLPCDGQPFVPVFPTCPYVTLVGATGGVPETGAFLSAGGFSNYFPTAKYQKTAVEKYIKSIGDEYKGRYNASGRAFPDVSAEGLNIPVYVEGEEQLTGGTSASSPIFTAVIALLNEELLDAGKKPLGFLNPWLYAHPEAFNDITSGDNPGCGTNGFNASQGWDPVTGLGSPNFKKLRIAAGLH